MSLVAWINYNIAYSWAAIKLPLSLTLWQHIYNWNCILIIQETADAYGLLCLGLLFLSAQIFSRNSLLSVFLYSLNDSARQQTSNRVKPLSTNSTSSNHLKFLFSSTVSTIKSRMGL